MVEILEFNITNVNKRFTFVNDLSTFVKISTLFLLQLWAFTLVFRYNI